jgi:hypothetical protein
MIDIYACDERTTTTTTATTEITTNIRHFWSKYVKRNLLTEQGGTSFSPKKKKPPEGQRCHILIEIRSGNEKHYVSRFPDNMRCY